MTYCTEAGERNVLHADPHVCDVLWRTPVLERIEREGHNPGSCLVDCVAPTDRADLSASLTSIWEFPLKLRTGQDCNVFLLSPTAQQLRGT